MAEVASTCNEALLIHYLLDQAKEPKERQYLISHFLESFRGTFFRQAMFAEFEAIVHQKAWDGEPLTAKEFELLSVLYRNEGRIVTIDGLCEAAWGDNPYGYENSLMAHIRRIREKIEENPSKPASLLTVKGLGYKLVLRR